MNPPRSTPRDPLFAAKQIVAAHGDDFTVPQVKATNALLRQLYEMQPYIPEDRGVNVRKWIKQGHGHAAASATRMLLESFLEPGQPLAHLLKHWSRSGARDRVRGVFRELEAAHTAGIWPSKNED